MSIAEQSNTIVRYSKPNKFDHAIQGTQCIVITDDETFLYLQISSDEGNPRWELIKVDPCIK